jgi:GT2 family glycosyltransferase
VRWPIISSRDLGCDQGSKSIGVVIPTHNRYKQLRVLLTSIREHWTDKISSVVVVDDSTKPVDLRSEFQDINLRQVILKSRVFISRAKNIGWKGTNAEYVYFIDDDNEIDNTTITPLFDIISRSAFIGALMPAVLYKTRPDLVWVYATPFSSRRLKHDLVGRNLSRNKNLEKRLLETDALPNASIARRRALEDVGGFDELLVVNSSMDLCLRMKAKNWQVFSYTGAFVYHDVEPPGRLGWWATHGAADPERVRYEIRDWFIIIHRLRGDKNLFILRALAESRFVIPNMLAHLIRGRSRRLLVKNLWKGYAEGLRITMQHEPRSYYSPVQE